MDCLVKAIADDIKIYAAITTDLVNEGITRHGCYPLASAALGRVMTGALLLAAGLKNEECITVSLRGDGPLGTITADASASGNVRGYVTHPKANLPLNEGKLAVGQGVGKGLLSVTRFTGLKEPVTGSCEIYSGEIAEDFTRYLFISEQIKSSVGLGVLVNKNFTAEAAGGFIIQLLPNAKEETIIKLENNLSKLRTVSQMIETGLNASEMILEILNGFDVEFLSTTDVAFKCQCSKHRTEDILLTLGRKELEQLVQDKHAEVCCSFCGEKYQFNEDELKAILNVSEELKRRNQKPLSFRNKDE